ncbi:hypothetical protein RRG08_019614 [Elysia crispata]|uniref:Uncharacterized protein n=1 Tax=Elysia crispata TaxID=231223 RepID=A0AAE1AX44_9GAST|nr:hypothetical protein RRG08_019614 [Elysia crispata]
MFRTPWDFISVSNNVIATPDYSQGRLTSKEHNCSGIGLNAQAEGRPVTIGQIVLSVVIGVQRRPYHPILVTSMER